MVRPTSWIERLQDERGQITILAAFLLIVVISFAALALDVGMFMRTKRTIQNSADAMALAGARDLPATTTAEDSAEDWGIYNEVDMGEVTDIVFGRACSGATIADTVTVRLKRNQETFFARILDMASLDLNVCATARKAVAAGGNSVLPFGFHRTDPYPGSNPDDVCYFYERNGTQNSSLWNDSCLIKIPKISNAWSSGNSGPLRLDEGGQTGNYDADCNPGSSGASEYSENITEGSECYYGIGDKVRPKTGNMRGPTCSALSSRLAGNTDTVSDVFGTATNGVWGPVDQSSPRFGLIPIVTASGTGSSATVTIVGFITVYIEGACTGSKCNGSGQNPSCVIVRPIRSEMYVTGVEIAGGGSLSDATNALRVIKLIE
jgi:hypothetical protein